MRKLILCTLVLMLSVAVVHAEPSNDRYENVKFGIHTRGLLFSKVGAFAEYKIHEAFGLQAGVLYFRDFYFMADLEKRADWAVLTPRYVAMPLILRTYPGPDRQFCMFAGLQLNYLVGGKILYYHSEESNEDIIKLWESLLKRLDAKHGWDDLKDKSQQKGAISYWAYHLFLGFDYEFLGGFQLGLEIGKGLSTLAKCKDSYLNWTCKLALGYNFAKLIN